MPNSTDLTAGRFARLLLVALIIVTIALLAWQIVDVLLLVFGAILLAVMLRRRMQGKSCFNFTRQDDVLLGELETLTAAGFARYQDDGTIPDR